MQERMLWTGRSGAERKAAPRWKTHQKNNKPLMFLKWRQLQQYNENNNNNNNQHHHHNNHTNNNNKNLLKASQLFIKEVNDHGAEYKAGKNCEKPCNA